MVRIASTARSFPSDWGCAPSGREPMWRLLFERGLIRTREGVMTTPVESGDDHEAIRSAQINALFRAGPLAVGSAAVASVVLLAILRSLRSVDAGIGSLRPVHSSACNATDTLLSRCNLVARRVWISSWRTRSFGPIRRTLPEVPRAHAITFGAFVAIRQVGPTRHVGGGYRTSG